MEYLEDTQDFYEYALPDVFFPGSGKHLSDCEGNEYVAEGCYKSNNDWSSTLHVEIPSYQAQKMNVNHLKDKLSKIKTSVWYKNILD